MAVSIVVKNITSGIDRLSRWVGYLGYFLLVAIVLMMSYEVVMRYIFNSPTVFALLISQLMLVMLVASTFALCLLEEGHVAITIISERLSPRKRGWLLCIVSSISVFVCGFMSYQMLEAAQLSCVLHEKAPDVFWPVFPFKIVLCIGLFLFALAFIARSYKYYQLAKGGIKKP